MKFMKLGTRTDTFCSLDDSTRSIVSEIPTDITIQVDATRFLLHKFPLLSRCSHLKKLHRSSRSPVFTLQEFPGGAAAFELCAKFCYGITITLSATNIVAAMSAAAYLEMTDEQEQGNLSGKLESFLTSCLLRGWKDSLTALRSTTKTPSYSEKLHIPSRCTAALSGMITGDPTREQGKTTTNIPWWAEDLVELNVLQFSAVVDAVRSSGMVPGEMVAEAIHLYLRRWPPEADLLEKVVGLLPSEKGSVRCGFLMKMLKVARFVGLEGEAKEELVRRAAAELENAEARELMGDVETVVEVVGEFMRSDGGGGDEKVVKIGRLVDWWLKETAGDESMTVEKLVEIAEMVPNWARKDHDVLYRSIDLHLKANPNLNKIERKRLCRVLDCKKLSVEACAHAAQNDRLPLRVVVQVLFFEQARAATSGTELPPNIKALLSTTLLPQKCDTIAAPGRFELENGSLGDEWSVSSMKCLRPNLETLRMKLAEEENGIDGDEDGDERSKTNVLMRSSSSRFKVFCTIQDKPKRMLTRLWSINRSINERH